MASVNGFGLRADQRVSILIDGPSLFATSRALGFDIDYRRTLGHFEERATLHRAMYFTAVSEGEDFSPVKPLVDWLEYNGFMLITKPLKDFTDVGGRRRIKGSIHPEMSVEMLEASQFADHLVLFSGDGELTYAVKAVQRRGVKVTAVSSMRDGVAAISDELRRAVDRFVDLADVKEIISKGDRPAVSNIGTTNSATMRAAPAAATILEDRRPTVGFGMIRRA